MNRNYRQQEDGGGGKSPAHVQKFLAGLNFPATKKAVIDHARKNRADNNVIQMLEKIPDQEYQNPAEVSQALSGEM